MLGEIGAALQFRQDQQNADQPAKPVTGRQLGLDLIPDGLFDLGRERVDQLVPLDHSDADCDLPAKQSLRRAGEGFGHESEQLTDAAVDRRPFKRHLHHEGTITK